MRRLVLEPVVAVAVRAMTAETLDSRVARLESDVANISINVADIKLDLREMRGTLERKFEAINQKFMSFDRKFTTFDQKFDGKIATLNQKIDHWAIWLISTLLGLGAAILGAMAAGFHWL